MGEYTNYGTKVSTGCDLNLVFPSAEVLANTDLSDVAHRTKEDNHTNFARSVVEGSIDFETSKDLQDIERSWCDLPGIGPWTAQVAAMRVLGHNDAMPASDLGILRSVNNIVKQDVSSAELQNQSKCGHHFGRGPLNISGMHPKSIGILNEQHSFISQELRRNRKPHPGEH